MTKYASVATLLAGVDEPDQLLALNPWLKDELGKKSSRGNKFNAQRCEFNGIHFDSKAEMVRYGDLRLLELTGTISALEVKPVYELPAGIKYIADFRYIEAGKIIVEDVKGGKATQTSTFKNKWKQVKHFRIILK